MRKTVPCQECRNRHVKCDGKKPACTRCKRSGASCVWQAVPSGFRHGSSARYDADFADDQIWLPITRDYKYVDETADVAREYSLELGEDTPWALVQYNVASGTEQMVTEPAIASDTVGSYSPGHWAHQETARDTSDLHLSPENSYSISPVSLQVQISQLSPNSHAISPSDNLVATETGLVNFDEHEACLMRYFVVQLGHWFDICDGQRHFACTVPVRALTCPPLLNAIYTVSARHLSKSKKYYVGNQVRYGGKYLPNLTPTTAIEYHNKCISHFVSISNHSREAEDENLLAAAVILRFYEEVDLPSIGEDNESALRGIQIFLDAQTIPSTISNPSLRNASYWIALRQEIITAFSKQRPFRLPLAPCDPYRTFEPADDYIWADRLVIHCADVLQFCFGSEHPSPSHESRTTHYETLTTFQKLWTELGPASFNPVYARDPDPARGEVFPELWFLNNCHVAGLQHLELARILLAVYDPRLPRLGPGQRTAMRSVDRVVRSSVLRLCGIAMSNLHSPPGLVTASAAIGMCGDRFVDTVEQEALFGALVRLEDEYGYPTHNVRAQLEEAWGWD